MATNQTLGTDSFYLDGDDPEAVLEAVELKKRDIVNAGGSIMNEQLETKRAGERDVVEARFDYQMPVGQLGEEVEFNPPDVEDPQGDTAIEHVNQ
ncbi:MAG: hypothetical protein ACR2LS_08965 [Thermomicrobiales bacterium]|jgi:hypothetical protein